MKFKVLPETIEQMAICQAVNGLYASQNLERNCELLSLEPMTFSTAVNLSKQQTERLFAGAVQYYLDGYKGELVGDKLVVSKQADDKPASTGKRRSSRSNATIQ